MPKVSMEDVARIAGVSLATVSSVIHSPDKVRAGTKSRVEEAIVQSGYVLQLDGRRLLSTAEQHDRANNLYGKKLDTRRAHRRYPGRAGAHAVLLDNRQQHVPGGQRVEIPAALP